MEYKFESQKALIYLTLGTISLIGFIGFMVVQKLYWMALAIGLLVVTFSRAYYAKSKRKMDGILEKIETL